MVKIKFNKILSIFMCSLLVLCSIPLTTISASTFENQVCLSSLEPIAYDRYTGNLGDSCMFNLDRKGLPGKDNNYYRNGNIGVDGSIYENGFEAWIARWNFGDKSWASITYDIGGNYTTLSGKTGLIKSYNTTNFDTTIYFYGDEVLLASYNLTSKDYNKEIDLDISGVEILKILVKDNAKVNGGTSFALYDMFLWGGQSSDIEQNTFSEYFANYLMDYWEEMSDVDMPCKTIIANGGMASLTWNTILESIKSLGNFELGVNEKQYYEAILLDLLADTVTSVNYEKEMISATTDIANKVSNYLISKGVSISKENLNKSDLEDLWDNLQDHFVLTDIETTKEGFDILINGCKTSEECIEKISTYIIVSQQSQNFRSAIKMMSEKSDYQPLTDCLNEIYYYMQATPTEISLLISSKEVNKSAKNSIGNYLLSVINEVLPLETVKDIFEYADWGCNALFPTTFTSEQMYRIYAINHIENITRSSFKQAYNNYLSAKTKNNAEAVTSCYEMFVRVYEHEISECSALADLLYNKGVLNGIKKFFSTKSIYDYQAAIDWVNSYNINLDIMKDYKRLAYIERGINLGILHPVRFVGIVDGKIAGFNTQFVDSGEYIDIPDYSLYKNGRFSLNPILQKSGTFEGWYYDEECTQPCMSTSIKVNKSISLYAKFSMENVKQVQVKCPVDIKIYNSNKELVVYIKNDEIIKNSDDLYITIINSQKNIILPCEEKYTIEINATDDGLMNYSITELEEGVSVRKLNFYDIPLYNQQSFDGSIEEGLNISKDNYELTTKSKEEQEIVLYPDEELLEDDMQNVSVSINNLGDNKTTSNKLVTKGDLFIAETISEQDYIFEGWYIEDKLVSTQLTYSFIVKENISLLAKFILRGDIDKDEHVNLNDLVTLAQYVAGWENLMVNSQTLDTNGDSVVDLQDVTHLARYLAGWQGITLIQKYSCGDVDMNFEDLLQ